MRVMYIGAGDYAAVKNLMSQLKTAGHELIYWVGSAGGETGRPADCVFHDYKLAHDGLPAAGLKLSDFAPAGQELIEKMLKTESLVLTMMNKHFDAWCVDERRHFYYNLLQYWYGVIKKYQPEVIIFPIVPHTVFNFVIYELARLLKVPTITFEDTWVSDRLLEYNDFWRGSDRLIEAIKNNQGKNLSLNDLSSDLRQYFETQTDQAKDSTPSYTKKWQKQSFWLNRLTAKIVLGLKSILDFSIFKKAPLYVYKYFKQNIAKEYSRLEVTPDFTKKFIYAPLNYQPERTTSPQGDIYVDQILMIETLSAALPDGWIIYVKEHPTQWLFRGLNYFSSRYPGYYERIARIKNVKLIPTSVDTYALAKASQAVATVTGTAGWEGILRGKPAVIFGYPWYRDCPGALKVNDAGSCRLALEKIKAGYKPEQREIVNYLKSFDQATIHGYVEGGIGANSNLSREDNAANINAAIMEEIFKINK